MPPAAQSGSSGETQAAAPPPDGVRTRSTDYQYVIWLFYAVVSLGLLASAVFVSPKHAMMALLWAMACFVSGGALGFIFGIPKVLQQQTAEAGAPADTTARPAARERANYRQEVNTNLTEISDWLTKMIVGVSLVNLKDIPPFIKSVAQVFALGMASSDPNRDFLPYCVAIIMFFTVLGFLFGYLSTRLYLAPAFARADVDAQAPVALALRGEVAILSATVAALTDVSLPAKPASAAPPTAPSTAPTGGATSMPAGGVPSAPAMPSPSPPVTQSSATPPQVLSAQEQAISAAQRALEANSIVDERQRITAKDQVANEIARLVIDGGITRDWLVAEATRQATMRRQDGLIAGLAVVANIAPEPQDFQRLSRVATLAEWPNTQHKVCFALGKLFTSGFATKDDIAHADRILLGYLRSPADEPLRQRIYQTAALISRTTGVQLHTDLAPPAR